MLEIKINSEINEEEGGTPMLERKTTEKIIEKKILDLKNLLKK